MIPSFIAAAPLPWLVGSLAILIISGRWTIHLLLNITRALGISEFAVAFIFLAIATSVPELFVSISSARQGAGDIVLAVALGSNIVNMTLIIGLATLLAGGISTSGLNLRRDISMGMLVNLMPIFFLLNGIISRVEGMLLIGAFLAYLAMLWREQSQRTNTVIPKKLLHGVASVFLLLGVIGILLVASEWTVDASVSLATALSIPSLFIGLFLLAIGTSLPEMTTTLQSAYRRKPTLALGNILGSNIADSGLIVGVASVVQPLHVTIDSSLIITIVSVIATLIAIGFAAFSHKRIAVSEGLLLLLLFTVFALSVIVTAPVVVD